MKKLLLLSSLVAAAIALWPAAPRSQSRAVVSAAVERQLASNDEISVIVGVDASFVPEGYLSADGVADQRDAIARVADDVMTRARTAGAVVGTQLDVLPFFTARVSKAALDALSTMPGVRSIEIDGLDAPTLSASVPLTNTPAAWAAGATGAGWRVAVIDTGTQTNHPFLTGKTVSEACYVRGGGSQVGTSTCPDGTFESVAVGSSAPCSVADDCLHGTHVAGIAVGANAPGGANGVAPGAQLVSIQAFTRFDDSTNCQGAPPCALSYSSDQVRGLQRVAALAGAGNSGQIAAVNMSLGGGQYFDQGLCDNANITNGRKAAIDNLRSLGVAVVIASGNNGFTSSMSSPGCISTAVSVGSTSKTAPITVSSFSNNAAWLSLLAPGGSILSSVTGSTYQSLSGTSMAAPHVAGAWAVLKQAAPSATVTQVLQALQNTGTVVNDTRAAGATAHRFINVNAARLALAGGGALPGTPGTFAASASGNTVLMSWGAASGATGYTVVARTVPGAAPAVTLPVGNVTSFSVAAPNGVYYLSVVGTNGSGAGPESNVVPVTVPATVPVPGTPTGLSVSVVGTTANFAWSAPSSGGPVAEYVLIAGYTPGFTVPAVSMPLPAAPTSTSVPGVPPGTYYVRVYARNAGGNSVNSSNEVTVNVAGPSAPGAPVLNTPSVAGGIVSLSWAPGGGGVPTSYTLYASLTPGGAPIASLALSGTSAAFPAPSGTYYLRMTASNAVGTSGLSNQVTLVVP